MDTVSTFALYGGIAGGIVAFLGSIANAQFDPSNGGPSLAKVLAGAIVGAALGGGAILAKDHFNQRATKDEPGVTACVNNAPANHKITMAAGANGTFECSYTPM
jgi:hypothetical protein